MASAPLCNDFEDYIKAQFEELQVLLGTEYRRSIMRQEAKLHALETENASLRRKLLLFAEGGELLRRRSSCGAAGGGRRGSTGMTRAWVPDPLSKVDDWERSSRSLSKDRRLSSFRPFDEGVRRASNSTQAEGLLFPEAPAAIIPNEDAADQLSSDSQEGKAPKASTPPTLLTDRRIIKRESRASNNSLLVPPDAEEAQSKSTPGSSRSSRSRSPRPESPKSPVSNSSQTFRSKRPSKVRPRSSRIGNIHGDGKHKASSLPHVKAPPLRRSHNSGPPTSGMTHMDLPGQTVQFKDKAARYENRRESKESKEDAEGDQQEAESSKSDTSSSSQTSEDSYAFEMFGVLDTWAAARARIASALQQQQDASKKGKRRLTFGQLPRHSVDFVSAVPGATFDAQQSFRKKQSRDSLSQDPLEPPEDALWIDTALRFLVVQPSSAKRIFWEFIGLLLVIYDIVVIPLQILQPEEDEFSFTMSWLCRLFWTADVIFSFFTGYISQHAQGMMEMRPSFVARHYLRTRFVLDLVIAGCDWCEVIVGLFAGDESGNAFRLISMLRALRPVRLLRLAKARNMADFVLEHIRSEGAMITSYVAGIVLLLIGLVHIIACLWYGVRVSTWGSGSGKAYRDGLQGSVEERYMESFHYVLGLFVGEHIMLPESQAQRFFTVSVLLIAFVTNAFLVGTLTTQMTRLQIIASQRSSQFAALNRYLTDSNISRKLSIRVQRNARHAVTERKRNTPESKVELLSVISEPLKAEIHYEVHSPLLTRHPFFRMYNFINPVGVRHICHTTIHQVSLSRGDMLFAEFEVPSQAKMYFIVSGLLSYSRGVMDMVKVGPKQWVAEPALWTVWAHRGSLQARSESQLTALDAQRFVNIMTTYPTLHAHLYAEKFVNHLNALGMTDELTDLGSDSDILRQLVANAFREVDKNLELPSEWLRRRASVASQGSMSSTVGSVLSEAICAGDEEAGRSSFLSGRLPAYAHRTIYAFRQLWEHLPRWRR
eukprot:TRINITY_DN28753_c0_g1_i1.p1 TRINITY_DN28753_c0_g1~~TRINITY_DN28753_c0_g1_i1.p1  ORF type:complete len:995 (+),score=148.19 TRINITY_DN28753_c0_g1_i1:51-3035(+)